ncbi:MAG: hypothetical protein PUD91_04600 [Bacteroidales bacterium]|nr:hypothetical protein [Bacteroidales bacterium]
MSLKNIVISDVTGQTSIKPEPTTATLTVPLPSGAELVGADALEVAEIYDADGVRRAALQQGVNIIRYANGTTKKVLVK